MMITAPIAAIGPRSNTLYGAKGSPRIRVGVNDIIVRNMIVQLCGVGHQKAQTLTVRGSSHRLWLYCSSHNRWRCDLYSLCKQSLAGDVELQSDRGHDKDYVCN